MVAYSFKKQFVPLISSGLKVQTVRRDRKRHARVGEGVQLYSGMRTKHCVKIIDTDPEVVSVRPVQFTVPEKPADAIKNFAVGGMFLTTAQQCTFAKQDGFASLVDFTSFWIKEHGPGLFVGVVIQWKKPQ